MEFFLKQGGQEVGDRNKPFKSSLCEPHKDVSMEQIREWIYTVTILIAVVLSVEPRTPGGPQGPFWGSKR